MKTRKLFLVLVLVAILLLGTGLVANAANKIRVNGGVNNTLFGIGWEWIRVNLTIDPVTHEAIGETNYMFYEDEYGKEFKFSWRGEAVCAAMGEFEGLPTIAVVTKIVEQRNIDPSWVGKYVKTTISDGGPKASEDIIGIVEFDYDNGSPVFEQPSCDFEEPFLWYFSQNGNLTIHD